MTAPVRRPSVPQAVGENRTRIRTLEAVAPWGPGVAISTAVDQTVPSVADGFQAATAIEFDTVTYESPDSEGMLDLGSFPTKIFIVRDGIYLVTGLGVWQPSTTTTFRRITVISNFVGVGAGMVVEGKNQGDATNPYSQGSSAIGAFTTGAYFELEALQTSGSPTNVLGGNMGVQWMAPFDGVYGPRF